LHGDLGLAVAVVVVHLELGVVRAGADVAAEVDAPQPGAVELVRVHVHVACVAGLRVVMGVGRIPLDHKFELPVAVEVPDAGVVGAVRVGGPVRGGTAGRHPQRHVQVPVGELERRLGAGLLDATDHGADRVRGVRGGAGIQVVGGVGDRRGVQPGAGPVYVE